MLELLLTIMYAVGVFLVDEVWILVPMTVVYFLLVAPGLYAMFFGAPYIPTDKKRMDAMMKLGDFRKDDIVYDLGCGDGRVIREVSKRGVKKAVGIEVSVLVYILAKIKGIFIENNATIRFGNFWKRDFDDADKLIVFLLERTMKDFEKKIWPKLKVGTIVLSNEFLMDSIEPTDRQGRVFLYRK